MSFKDGKITTHSEIITEKADKTKVRGARTERDLLIETFTRDEGSKCSSGSSVTSRDSTSTTDKDSPGTISYFSGNPFVEVTKGILHLYKENERTLLKSDGNLRSEMLVILGVPSSMNCGDLILFIAPFQSEIEHIQIIRDVAPNQYMALLKFSHYKKADNFYDAFNGIPYNSFEEGICHIAYVSRVETLKESKGAGLPLAGHTELPTCPVCLERMDESVDGVLTILCNHSFHSRCLAKWSDASCPVCRYQQTPEFQAGNQCMECSCDSSLWFCLICGHVGCGRYEQGHAFKHFLETQHCYALDPANNRVWDYVGDNFVHRLLANKSDGKLVEVSAGSSFEDRCDCEDSEVKVDAMQLEFTYLLSTQLETQRNYYEERLTLHTKDLRKEMDSLKFKLEELTDQKSKAETQLTAVLKEKAALDKKVATMGTKLLKAFRDLSDEKEMNACLQSDQRVWQEKLAGLEKDIEAKKAEATELKDQLRDLMFFIEGAKQIEDSPLRDEIAQGHVVVEPPPPTSQKQGRRKRR